MLSRYFNLVVGVLLFLATFVFTRNKIGKIEGGIFIGLYLSYLMYNLL